MATSRAHDRTGTEDDAKDVDELVEQEDRRRGEAVERRRREYLDYLMQLRYGLMSSRQDSPVSPFLLIPYLSTDLGIRPMSPHARFWESPYITVDSSDPSGNPVAGEANFLHARVFNLGEFLAAPVQVDFYWADPSLGLGPANMNFIGSEYVEVPSLTSVDVMCTTPWVPDVVNNGHECVMVNCTNWILDPIIQPFQPTLDRHVGQRNLHVVSAPAGAVLGYRLRLTNLLPIAVSAVVTAVFDYLVLTEVGRQTPFKLVSPLAATHTTAETASPLHAAGLLRRGSTAHRTAQRALALARQRTEDDPVLFERVEDHRAAVRVVASLGNEHGVIGQTCHHGGGDLLTSLGEFQGPVCEPAGVPIQQVNLEPYAFQAIEVELTVPGDATVGDLFVTHLAQHSGPITTGGYTIIMHVT